MTAHNMILECCLLAATAVVVYDQVLIIPDMFHVLKRRGFSGVSWILSLNQITLLVKTICSIPVNDAILRAIGNCDQAMGLSFLVIGVTLTTDYITDIGAVEIITRVSAVLSDILAIGGTWYYNISVYKMAYNANIKHSLAYIILRDANISAYTNPNEVTQHASAATSDDTAIQDISFDQSIRRTISLRFASRISDAMGGPLEYMSVSGETLEDEYDDLSDAGEEDQPLSTGYVAVAKDDTDETEEGLLESNI
ncbi:predicted protein [Postia placenta Mad-698-R]|nr:predicted protein [Postia placenta Mad-698-R]